MTTSNCQYSTRYCWDADKVKALIRLRAELSPLFTGKRNASKYAWAVVERELNVPLPLSKIIKKWNNLLQEYKLSTNIKFKRRAIKISEEPKRREWPFFTLMDVYFSDQVNDPSLRLFSSTKTLKESLDESVFEDDPIIVSAIAAVTSGACMEIEELLKRQKDRRANENKFVTESKFTSENQFSSDKLSNSKAKNYRICENKTNVVTVKNLNCMQQQVNIENNLKTTSDLHDLVKNEKVISPKPMPGQQQSSPSPAPQNKLSDPNSIDQYLLSWNNFLGNMSRGFHTLQKDEKMVDVTIAAGGKIFKAHKLVLSVCSPYFQEIFLENPSNHPILLMADVEASHMAGLLNFMYSGQVNVKYEDLPVFLKVAEAMKIKGLHTEKPEGQNLEEIQFSRDDTSADMQALNSSSMPINCMEQSTAASFTPEKERQCHTSFHPINPNKNLDQQYNMNTLNFEQASNKFSILKTNGSKKLSEHLKQQKYLTKRKIFLQCENEFKEKKIIEMSEKDLYNSSHTNLVHMTQRTLHPDNSNNEEILNLAQNGAPNVPKRFVPAIPMEPKIDSTYYNRNSLSEIRDEYHKDRYKDDKIPFFGSKSNEDGNNNTLDVDEVAFVPNNNNVAPSKNYTNNCYNVRSENDDNNNGSKDSNYDIKKNLKKQADNNNNVFLEAPSNIDNDKDSNTEETKIKSYSNLY